MTEETDVLVVGAGQAGVAMSEHLTAQGIDHLVLERHRIAERWRTERWDSLVANGPAWHDRFPNMEFEDVHPDGFATKDQVADYMAAYARRFDAPIRCGVEVTAVRKRDGAPGFVAETSEGTLLTRHVVAATGPFQKPVIPDIVPEEAGIHQLHSSSYRRPEQLPEGNVLVVGAGSSGVQIADEVHRSGRRVHLAVGPHDRPPRRYRDRDFVWWLGVLNKWEATAASPDAEHVTISVSGAHGGRTVDFRELAASGIQLVGRVREYQNGRILVDDDLERSIAAGDANYLELLQEADAFVERNGLDLPAEPEAHELGPYPPCVTDPLRELDVVGAGITTILWATGFSVDYSWLQVDAFDSRGRPRHERGISSEPGVHFLGLPWQSRRGSSFIWGVWHDAKHLADHIAVQRSYLKYAAGPRPGSDADRGTDEDGRQSAGAPLPA